MLQTCRSRRISISIILEATMESRESLLLFLMPSDMSVQRNFSVDWNWMRSVRRRLSVCSAACLLLHLLEWQACFHIKRCRWMATWMWLLTDRHVPVWSREIRFWNLITKIMWLCHLMKWQMLIRLESGSWFRARISCTSITIRWMQEETSLQVRMRYSTLVQKR